MYTRLGESWEYFVKFEISVCEICLQERRELERSMFALKWTCSIIRSLVQGVLPTVPDQKTEETQSYAPKAGASSQVWEQRGRKKNVMTSDRSTLCSSKLSVQAAENKISRPFLSYTAVLKIFGVISYMWIGGYVRMVYNIMNSYMPFIYKC
jgi:hypothetical protein